MALRTASTRFANSVTEVGGPWSKVRGRKLPDISAPFALSVKKISSSRCSRLGAKTGVKTLSTMGTTSSPCCLRLRFLSVRSLRALADRIFCATAWVHRERSKSKEATSDLGKGLGDGWEVDEEPGLEGVDWMGPSE